jgi:hypothetical protein
VLYKKDFLVNLANKRILQVYREFVYRHMHYHFFSTMLFTLGNVDGEIDVSFLKSRILRNDLTKLELSKRVLIPTVVSVKENLIRLSS